MSKRAAGNIDKIIGAKIRQLRTENGLTMQEFAGRIGVAQQQAHKYERGTNRVSVSRLYMIAEALNVSPSYFFDELPDKLESKNIERRRKNTELVKYFQSIPSLRHQDAISILVRVLSGE